MRRHIQEGSRRVAIFIQQGLGDVALALRAVQRIRDHFAGQAIVVVKSDLEKQLIELAVPELSSSTVVASAVGGHPVIRWGRIALALRRAQISDIVGLHLRDTMGARVVARLAGAFRVELNKFDADDGRHKTAHYAALADRVTGETVPAKPFRLDGFAEASQRSVRRHIVLAPGSGVLEAHKRWPEARYSELIRLLHDRDASTPFVLLGAPGERALLESIADGAPSARANVHIVAAATIRDSLAVLADARVVIGGCGGSLHLAALMNAPIIGVYGPTNPGWTGPDSSVVRIVHGDFDCAPCYAVDFIRGCGNPECMQAVSATTVLSALTSIEADPNGNDLPWYPLSKLRVATPTRPTPRRVSADSPA